MEVTNDNIKFMKRQLQDYGYYTDLIDKSENRLIELRERIKECYKASGISYDVFMKSSDPNYSRAKEIIDEEYGEYLHKKELENKRHLLGLDHLINKLNKEQYDLIKLHYFEGYTQAFIAVNKNYSSREKVTKKIKKIITFFVKNY